ncbi:MAG: DUF4330 domain-containing protein [Actinobacteria bacterium]|nr:DUF4330 domain-containing protein [Actinomycetota bacterium]
MTTFIDRQGRLFGKVSVVDILILVLLVALVLFAFVRFSKPAAAVTVETKLTMEKQRDPTVNQFEVGLPVYDEGGALLGHVEKVEAVRTPLDVFTADGQPVPGAVSQVYWDLSIWVKGKGHDSGSAISVGGIVLNVGMSLQVHGPGFDVRTQVQQVRTVAED